MPKMLPALPQAFGNLKEVFLSAALSVQGKDNPQKLPKVANSLVIMVDGLGWFNVTKFAGHAPFLTKQMTKGAKGYSSFPSTTAASIVSLATGSSPSESGFFGYRLYDRTIGESVNMLTGLTPEQSVSYLKAEPITRAMRSSCEFHVVTKPEYLGSGFSAVTFPECAEHGEVDIERRFSAALDLLNSGAGRVIYLYVPELDQTAHRSGSNSSEWIALLELVDREVKKVATLANKKSGIILTADHGIVDVPNEQQFYLDECEYLRGKLLDVGGDPRALFIYLQSGIDSVECLDSLNAWLDPVGRAFAASDIFDFTSELMPDLVILAGRGRAGYHRDFAKAASMRMIGQHGGLTDEEISIPILRLAGYSSLLVP